MHRFFRDGGKLRITTIKRDNYSLDSMNWDEKRDYINLF
jgi:hypothetical protein